MLPLYIRSPRSQGGGKAVVLHLCGDNWILDRGPPPITSLFYHLLLSSVASTIGPRLTQIPMQLPPLPLTSYQNTSLLSLPPLSDMSLLRPHPRRFVLAFNGETL